MTKRIGDNHPMHGRRHSEATKNKMRATKLNRLIEKYAGKIDKIVELYTSGQSLKNVAGALGTNNKTVRKLLDYKNIIIRNQGSKYILDDYFFECIDDEKKAYWLGVLATDGSVRGEQNRNEIVLSLKIGDRQHVEQFIRDIGSTSKVYFVNRNGSRQAYASITSKKLKRDLAKLGVIPNKTLNISPPTLDDKMRRHFWRGCFDGDGCISMLGKKSNLSFNGTYDMVEGFKSFVSDNIAVNDNKIIPRCNIYSIKYGAKKDVQNILKLLYLNSTVSLHRKYEFASMICGGTL